MDWTGRTCRELLPIWIFWKVVAEGLCSSEKTAFAMMPGRNNSQSDVRILDITRCWSLGLFQLGSPCSTSRVCQQISHYEASQTLRRTMLLDTPIGQTHSDLAYALRPRLGFLLRIKRIAT